MSTSTVGGRATWVRRLQVSDFRCFHKVDVVLPPGLTVVHGANAQGKTSLLEAAAWIARGRSFRGVADAALVRTGTSAAVVRSEVATGDRTQLFEAEIRATGRNLIRCNTHVVNRRRDLHGLLRASVFSPDDLALVKSGPAARREYLDELLGMLAARYDGVHTDYERVLRQRNALLRAGVRQADDRSTLDVFDAQLVRTATDLVRGRLRLVEQLEPEIRRAYAALAGDDQPVGVTYEASWGDAGDGAVTTGDEATIGATIEAALRRARRAEIERRVTLVGPHRDEIRISIAMLDARTQASQGEQRTLALAMRLAGHTVMTARTGTAPLLLLDDVFSELDPLRSDALVRNLPDGQTLLTTAGAVPRVIAPDQQVWLRDGRVCEAA